MFKRVPLPVVVLIGTLLVYGMMNPVILGALLYLPAVFLSVLTYFAFFISIFAAAAFMTFHVFMGAWAYLNSFYRASARSLMLAGGTSAVVAFSMGILYGVLSNM
ncbi:MAG: hypothetical protein KC777_06620 [Cyanobacteria bacterium HKST-UBA02]|nr:hypothetical protein [Cyanobacteria bacterium HKST-UBA02]